MLWSSQRVQRGEHGQPWSMWELQRTAENIGSQVSMEWDAHALGVSKLRNVAGSIGANWGGANSPKMIMTTVPAESSVKNRRPIGRDHKSNAARSGGANVELISSTHNPRQF